MTFAQRTDSASLNFCSGSTGSVRSRTYESKNSRASATAAYRHFLDKALRCLPQLQRFGTPHGRAQSTF